jgi:hypothetical protein
MVVLFFLGMFFLIVYALYSLIRKGLPKASTLLSLIKKSALLVASLYLIFQLSWGLNYHRIPFAQQANLATTPTSVEELAALCTSLMQQANNLRGFVAQDERGVFRLSETGSNLYASAQKGYDAASNDFPMLARTFGTPKGVLLSSYWSYTGTSGMYFPLTGEANVNTTTPAHLIPVTMTHEMAHQHGYAREDEANFIGYLTAIHHPSPDFQYSATMLALNNAMRQLYRADPKRWEILRGGYSDGILRDLTDHRFYQERYQGRLWETSSKVNNQYLILNSQSDGVQSYGRMVDLLLSYRRQDPSRFDDRVNHSSFFPSLETEIQKPSS